MQSVAIYHVMLAKDDFDTTANMLFKLVQDAAKNYPGKPRVLYFDIEGHRNPVGGFDHDAEEIQTGFLVGFLGRWLTELSYPLLGGKVAKKLPEEQREDIPARLHVNPRKDQS